MRNISANTHAVYIGLFVADLAAYPWLTGTQIFLPTIQTLRILVITSVIITIVLGFLALDVWTVPPANERRGPTR